MNEAGVVKPEATWTVWEAKGRTCFPCSFCGRIFDRILVLVKGETRIRVCPPCAGAMFDAVLEVQDGKAERPRR